MTVGNTQIEAPTAEMIDASGLGRLLDDLSLICLDVGARRGFTADLLSLARAIDAIGFEPDREECDRLNEEARVDAHPWRSLRFIPVALGAAKGVRRLNIYRQRGCSSLLEADRDLAALFSRADYYELDDTIEVETEALDAASRAYSFEGASFLKLDIQGAELEVLSAAERLLTDSLLALRVEVSFLPIYKNQPLFTEVDGLLQRYGFMPQRFLELHAWRRTTRTKLPKLAEGSLPYSQGQMVHGDMLYFRHPEAMPDDGSEAIQALIKAALIAIAYGHLDHAAAIFKRPAVARQLSDRYQFDGTAALSHLSMDLARAYGAKGSDSLRRKARRFLTR